MKKGLLVVHPKGKFKNMGDYVQSVAQAQYLDKVDYIIDREQLHSFKSSEKVRLIMNGWFMHNPKNFPPSDCIEPLFVSFHINPKIADDFLTTDTIDYLKKHAPIGARDMGTRDLLLSKGIDSYFSGCLTLCLGKKYKIKNKTDEILFVNPYYELGGGGVPLIKFISAFFFLLKNILTIIKLNKVFKTEIRSSLSRYSKRLDKILHTTSFYEAYSKMFTDEVLLKAKYLEQVIPSNKFNNDKDRLEFAEKMINSYASAQFVVTSRIHTALPCLAVETPVILINNPNRIGVRLGGNMELFHIGVYKNNRVVPKSEVLVDYLKQHKKVATDYKLSNLPNYKTLRDRLDSIVSKFISIQ